MPVLRVSGTQDALTTVGSWPEVWRVDSVPTELAQQSDNYYTTTVENVLDTVFGYDGTGQTIAQYEGNRPDSWANLTGAPAGNCQGYLGNQRLCHCAAGALSNHPRLTIGVARRATGILGMANDATTIMANHGLTPVSQPVCQSHGDRQLRKCPELGDVERRADYLP